jgi:hypothetical protein
MSSPPRDPQDAARIRAFLEMLAPRTQAELRRALRRPRKRRVSVAGGKAK